MSTHRKRIVAVTNNLATLNLDSPAARRILSGHHHWSADGINFILVAETSHWRMVQNYLTANGAIVAPHCQDNVNQVGVSFASLIPASHGVQATDTAWAAFLKIARGAGWPAIDPVEF